MQQPTLDSLVQAFQNGDRQALARLLSLAGQGALPYEIVARATTQTASGRVVAITGSAGVGKSTLIGKLIDYIRSKNQTVAVLACDPQSPLSGGALLGDRFRMPARPEDPGIFIRSLASHSGQGAIAEHLDAMVRLLQSFGFENVLIETVGAGQGDVAVRECADVVVLLLQPEAGDDLQWEKAGVLEVADVFVIHKGDLPQAEQVEAQVRGSLELSGQEGFKICRASSKTGQGIAEVWAAIEQFSGQHAVKLKDPRRFLRLAQEELAHWFVHAMADPAVAGLLNRWQQGQVPDHQAGAELLRSYSTSNRRS